MINFLNKKRRKYYPAFLLTLFTICLFFGVGRSFINDNITINPTNAQEIDVNRKNPNTIKFVHLSDIHIDTKSKDDSKRLYAESSLLLKDAIEQINAQKNINFVMFSGDLVNRPDENDFMEFIKAANKLKYPWYVSTGNHDIGIGGGLSKSKFTTLLASHSKYFNSATPYYTFCPQKGYRVVVMDGVITTAITANGFFSDEQLKWLDSTLSKYKNDNVIIFQHHPIVEPYASSSHRVLNDKHYLKILQKHNNVIALMSGHYHAAKIQKRDGILHVSTPALVEYPNAFRIITVKDLSGKNGKMLEFDFDFKETGLKDLQALSKSRSKSYALSEGEEKDRNAVIFLDKSLKIVPAVKDKKEITKKTRNAA